MPPAATPPIPNPRPSTPLHHWNSGEISRREKMLLSGTDPESYITEYTFAYEDQ